MEFELAGQSARDLILEATKNSPGIDTLDSTKNSHQSSPESSNLDSGTSLVDEYKPEKTEEQISKDFNDWMRNQRPFPEDAMLHTAAVFENDSHNILNALDENGDSLLSREEIRAGITSENKPGWLPGLKILDKQFDNIKGLADRGRLTEASGISAIDIKNLGSYAESRIRQERQFVSARKYASSHFNAMDSNGDQRVSYDEFSKYRRMNSVSGDGADALSKVFGKVASGLNDRKVVPDSSFSMREIMDFDVAKQHRDYIDHSVYSFASKPHDYEEEQKVAGVILGTIAGVTMGASIPVSIIGATIGYGIVSGVDLIADRMAANRRLNLLQNEILPEFLDK